MDPETRGDGTKEAMEKEGRELPFGAHLVRTPGDAAPAVRFDVWAPLHERVAVVVEGEVAPMQARSDGWFEVTVRGIGKGARYGYRLGDDPKLYPDPASRSQPDGVHELSEVIDPTTYTWRHPWRGAAAAGQVIYEMHVGAFTEEGTWRAAVGELDRLAALGVTVIEMMPVATFPGDFGWGYDGVALYAPSPQYGTPDDLRHFIDEAHGRGLAVILDVVYNHLGPSGNYLTKFAAEYFTKKYPNEWGDAVDFESARPARDLFARNPGYWVTEFRVDGLRFDATQSMHDASPRHVLAEMSTRARRAAGERPILLVAECESQDTRLLRPADAGGYGLDAVWNDDFHHTAVVAATGRREAYYRDYAGSPQELVSAMRWGYLFQGTYYGWQKKRRGTPALDLPARSFVACLENHDQVANSRYGERLHALTSPARWRALVALLLLGPETPMLFMGEEHASRRPFLYFADHEPELAQLVASGRRDFLRQFDSVGTLEADAPLPLPHARATFTSCKLDPADRDRPEGRRATRLYTDLLRLRREDAVIASQRQDHMFGAVLGPEAFILRFLGERAAGDRLLMVNLGRDLHLQQSSEPLLAPPAEARWRLVWSSEATAYGGRGQVAPEREDGWLLPGESAALLTTSMEDHA